MVNMTTRDSMASYAIAFLRQGTDNLLVALRSMSRYIPLAGYFFSNIRRFDIFVQSLSCEILISKVEEWQRLVSIQNNCM